MKYFVICLLIGITIYGCQPDQRIAAPLGERAALEQLAGAYESLADQLPLAPTELAPQGKRKFVEDVFKKAGYDFGFTLSALAQVSQENLTPHHKDMMELLFLPHRGLSKEDREKIYSQQELAAITKIEALY